MTKLLPELAETLPPDLQLDGELVAFNEDGAPDFDAIGRRMLHGDNAIDVTYVVFDVLACEGLPTTANPYEQRRALLEELHVDGPCVQTIATFEDGDALFRVMCDRGLEGVVAKRLRDPYRPGERLWVKTKNRATARFADETAGVRGRVATRVR